MTDQERDFILGRLVNYQRVAEGSTVPPRITGSVRIPTVSGLTARIAAVRSTTVEYLVEWREPEGFTGSISHYEVWVTMTGKTESPQGPYIAKRSPALVIITKSFAERPFFVFHVLTVLNSGAILPFESAPSTTAPAISVVPTSVPTDPGATLPTDPNTPVIVYFSASPGSSVQQGYGVLLQWSTSNTTSVTLNGNPVSTSGSTTVTAPTMGTSTSYTLTAFNGGNSVNQTITLHGMELRATQALAHVIRYTGTAPSW